MTTHRLERINELVKRELALILLREAGNRDLDPARVTVTRVVTSADLQHARVFVSVLGDQDAWEHAMVALKAWRRELQSGLARRVKLKFTPRLIFEEDRSLAEGDRVLGLIRELEAEEETQNGKRDDTDRTGSGPAPEET